MKSTLLGRFIMVLLLFGACSQASTGPKDPIWNKETCARCRMSISEKNYTVQRVFADGRNLYYDDLNCALKHEKSIDASRSELYVFPRGLDKWIKASEARFDGGLTTPMGSGFGAVSNGKLDFKKVRSELKLP